MTRVCRCAHKVSRGIKVSPLLVSESHLILTMEGQNCEQHEGLASHGTMTKTKSEHKQTQLFILHPRGIRVRLLQQCYEVLKGHLRWAVPQA